MWQQVQQKQHREFRRRKTRAGAARSPREVPYAKSVSVGGVDPLRNVLMSDAPFRSLAPGTEGIREGLKSAKKSAWLVREEVSELDAASVQTFSVDLSVDGSTKDAGVHV